MNTVLALIVWASGQCSAPIAVSGSAVAAALIRGQDPVVAVAYLCSEHKSGRWSGECGDAGASCGPWQLKVVWPRYFGLSDSSRESAALSAWIGTGVIAYSQERCNHGHDWRAHMKCARDARDECVHPVSEWKRLESEAREYIDRWNPTRPGEGS